MKRILLLTIYFLFSFTNDITAQQNHIVDVGFIGGTGILDVFTPDSLNINIGDTVTWNNIVGFHNVNGTLGTFPNNPEGFGNAPSSSSWTFSHIFNIPGSYDYHCDPHAGMGMVGFITVNPSSSNPTLGAITTTDPSCPSGLDGDIVVNVNQTNPVQPVNILFYWENAAGFWVQITNIPGSTNPINSLNNNFYAGNWMIILEDVATGNNLDTNYVPFNDGPYFNTPPASLNGSSINPTTIVSNDGEINVIALGQAPYSFTLTGPSGLIQNGTGSFTGLSDGLYEVEVINDNGCDTTLFFTLTAGISCSADPITTTNITCYSNADGQIHITGVQAIGLITYRVDSVDPSLNNPSALDAASTWATTDTFHTFSDQAIPGLNATSNYALTRRVSGNPINEFYYVTVEDATGCIIFDGIPIEVDRDGGLYQIQTTITLMSDSSNSDGSYMIDVNPNSIYSNSTGGYPNGANPPYQAFCFDPSGAPLQPFPMQSNSQGQFYLDSLSIGQYSIFIEDNGPHNCATDTIVLNPAMSVAPPCNPVLSNLINNICPGDNLGQATFNFLSGYGEFNLNNDSTIGGTISVANLISNNSFLNIDQLSSGLYNIELLSNGACSDTTIFFTILEPEFDSIQFLNAFITPALTTVCNSDSTQVLVEFSVPDSSISYQYLLRDFPAGNPLNVPGDSIGDISSIFLTAGDYNLELYYNDTVQCSNYQQPFTINEYKLEILNVTTNDAFCPALGEINIDFDDINISNPPVIGHVNGLPPSATQIGSPIIFSAPAAVYDSIYIEDAKGCQIFWSNIEVIENIVPIQANIFTEKETCRENDGIISIIPSNGVQPYLITIDSDTVCQSINESDTCQKTTMNASQNIVITIEDDAQCIFDTIIEITKVAPLKISSIQKNKETCCGFDGSIIVDWTGEGNQIDYTLRFDTTAILIDLGNNNYPYMDGLSVWPSQSFINTFELQQDSAHFVNLTRGYYDIHISDIYGCKDSIDYIYNQGLTNLFIDTTLASQLSMQISENNILCYDSVNGNAKVLFPNICYDYQLWLYNDTLNPVLIFNDTSYNIDSLVYFDDLNKGIYGIQAVSHSNYKGCIARSDTFVILEPTLITYDAPLSTPAHCLNGGYAIDGGSCNGAIWLPNSPIGGVVDTSTIQNDTSYRYYINRVLSSTPYFSPSPPGAISTDSMYTGLCPGIYEVQVFDANNCIIRDTVEVLDNSLYIDTISTTSISCYDSTDATISISSYGGVGGYIYVWKDSMGVIIDSTSATIIDTLSEGVYYVTVYDSSGCIAVDSAIINPAPNELIVQSRRSEYDLLESCLGESYDGRVAFEIIGGNKPYIFSWQSETNNSLNGTISAVSIPCDTCVSTTSGVAIDSIYTLTNLTSDIYRITLSDINGCILDSLWLIEDSVEVLALNRNNPLIIDNLSYNQTICNGADSANILININSVATWPLNYSLYTGGYSLSLGNSVFGGPTDTTIGFGGHFTGNRHLELTCTSPSKLVSAVVYAATQQPITFELRDNNGVVIDDTTITVQVGEQRLYFDFDIPVGTDLELGVSSNGSDLYRNQTGANFPYNIGSAVSITGTNASPGYYYFFYDLEVQEFVQTQTGSSCDSLIVLQGDSLFTGLPSDTFCIVITDVYGCTIDTTLTINQYEPLVISIDSFSHISCYDSSNGWIEVSTIGGAPDYNYLWTHNSSTDNPIYGLSQGFYTVVVTDDVGCTSIMDSIFIGEPTPLQLSLSSSTDVNCYNDDKGGKATIDVIGGTPQYTHSWSNGETGPNAIELLPGINTDTVRDARGCEAIIDVFIGVPDTVVLTVIDEQGNLCDGDSNGVIVMNASGGFAPYTYHYLDHSTGVVVQQPISSNIFDNLIEGIYELVAKDSKGCTSSMVEGEIKEPGPIVLSVVKNNLTCFETNDGELHITFVDTNTNTTGGLPPYDYTLYRDNNFITASSVFDQFEVLKLKGLLAGNYSIDIIDNNGCNYMDTMMISQPDLIVADFDISSSLINEGNSIQLTNLSLPLSGSNFVNQFTWNFGDGNQSIDFEPSHLYQNQGNYEITLVANNSDLPTLCSDTASLLIDVEGYDVNNVFTPNGDNINDYFGFNDYMLLEISVQIYNRWGKKIYHWNELEGYWDGRGYNGEFLPDGVYFFNMEAVGENGNAYIEKGSITLIR